MFSKYGTLLLKTGMIAMGTVFILAPILLARAVFSLTWEEVVERVNAVADYAMALPVAQKQFAVMGFCWGGRTAFAYAGERPDLGAAIVYYGESPSAEVLAPPTLTLSLQPKQE